MIGDASFQGPQLVTLLLFEAKSELVRQEDLVGYLLKRHCYSFWNIYAILLWWDQFGKKKIQ